MGTAICGGSAIAAVSPVIGAKDDEIAYAMATIFLFNVIAVLIFPPLGHLLKFSDTAFGLWAGTAVNDTSSVVAAGYAFSNQAGAYATIVKLTRTTMIIPVSLIFAGAIAWQRKKLSQRGSAAKYSFTAIFPWFILGFLLASLLNTLGLLKGNTAVYLSYTGKFLIVMALAAVGLSADLKQMVGPGLKPLLLGLIVWFVVSLVSIGVQFMTAQI